ncbi:MAG: methionyl-tRNA formyltransferase [Phycisphaerae bacterium]|nr:methionyl-tRNA formyltransferase [Phycisphaerae bacterium]
MRVIFCGSGDFALPTFRALAASGHEISGVVTQPPRRAGRGGTLRPTLIEQAAREANLSVHACANINNDESLAFLRSKTPDVICVVEFGQFLRAPARQAARYGAINLHGSLLPALRGAAPVNWAILQGFKTTGVTTFSLVDKMDAGPVFLRAELAIGPEERAGELRLRLAELGAETMLRTLEAIQAGRHPQPQDDSRAGFAPLLKKSDGFLDFRIPAEHVVWKVRGLWPWPGARAVFGHTERKAQAVTIAQARPGEGPACAAPGVLDEDLCVSTAQGRVEIVEIQPAGKRVMSWRDFIHGYRVAPGDAFRLQEAAV